MRAIHGIGFVLLAAALVCAPLSGQGMNITQINSDRLLSSQITRLYISAPALSKAAAEGLPEFEVWESGDGERYSARPVSAVFKSPNRDEGISFFLLLDNSGSMWTDLEGRETDRAEDRRVEAAKAAARAFLSKLSDKDRVGLAVFNTRLWSAALPGQEPAQAARALDEIRRPDAENAFTELYLSMDRCIERFAAQPGRRVLLVLSDGENYPYALKTGKPNPETGVSASSPARVIDKALREGIGIYALRFGAQKDPMLGKIAEDSGGRAFDAMNEEELTEVYYRIRDDLLSEIAVDYRAGMDRGEKRFVRVQAVGPAGAARAERFYYTGTVLGQNAERPSPWLLILPLIAALAWLALVLFKLERETQRTGLRLLFGAAGQSGGQSTRFFELAAPQTVIGANADISIAGNPDLRESHATIVFDKDRNFYTLLSDAPVAVNNQSVNKKRLESGDVINMAGTIVVFDEALVSKQSGAKMAATTKKSRDTKPKDR